MINKKCLECDLKFKVHNYRVNAKYCSPKCYQKNWKPPKNRRVIKKGQRISIRTELKKGHFEPKAEKSQNWKGDNAKYISHHKWVKDNKGRPDTCEQCKRTGLKGSKIHWANIDHRYKRILDDYKRLCAKCHSQYDRKNGLFGLRKVRFK